MYTITKINCLKNKQTENLIFTLSHSTRDKINLITE